MSPMNKNSIESLIESVLLQQQKQRVNLDHREVAAFSTFSIDNSNVQLPQRQQQQQQRCNKPYTLLLQHTQSFMYRYQNSNVSSPHRQQQQQQQPWLLQSGELWLEYIATLILEQYPVVSAPSPSKPKIPPETRHGNNNHKDTTGMTTKFTNNSTTAILFLSTLPITKTTSTIQLLQSKYGSHRVTNISCCRIGSLMDIFDDDDEKETYDHPHDAKTPQPIVEYDLERLDTIIMAVQQRISSSTITAILMDSITPILLRHGYNRTLQFLQQLITMTTTTTVAVALPSILMILPIRMEMLTCLQRSTLEQTIQFDAILNVVPPQPLLLPPVPYHGNINGPTPNHCTAVLVRRGVQVERRDHIRRDTVPYRVIAISTTTRNDHNADDSNSNIVDIYRQSSLVTGSRTNSSASSYRRYCIDCDIVLDSGGSNEVAPQSDSVNDNNATTPAGVVASQLSTLSVAASSSDNNDRGGGVHNIGSRRSGGTYSPLIAVGAAASAPVVQLQLDDGNRRRGEIVTNERLPPLPQQQLPNIYMDKNDPDYYNSNNGGDDYDEDEPDDDLDI